MLNDVNVLHDTYVGTFFAVVDLQVLNIAHFLANSKHPLVSYG